MMLSQLTDTQLMLAVFIGVLGLFGVLLWAFGPSGSKKAGKRAAKLKQRRAGKSPEDKALSTLRKQMGEEDTPMIALLFGWMPRPDYLHTRLYRTGKGITVRQYLLLNIALVLMLSVIFIKGMGLLPILGGLISFSIGILLPHMVVSYLIKKRMGKFISLFPDTIELIVRGLRSGLPVGESFHAVEQEIEDPIGSTFATVNERIVLGISMEEALEQAAEDIGITEFDFFVTSIKLQRETGGNLAEILHNLAEAIRGRLMMRMKVKALSAEAKTSAIIVGSLPFLIAGAIGAVSPEYLAPLFEDLRGNIAIAIGLCSMTTGCLIMAKMAKFEI